MTEHEVYLCESCGDMRCAVDKPPACEHSVCCDCGDDCFRCRLDMLLAAYRGMAS